MEVIFVLAILWLGFSHRNLARRVKDLEARLGAAAPQPSGAVAEGVPAGSAEPPPAAVSGPWQEALPAAEAPPAATAAAGIPAAPAVADEAVPRQDHPVVFSPERFAALGRWLRDNWVYAVSALSLALAGVFFVQYGVERGLLPPAARVALAILFGLALIAGGETIRRRWGDSRGPTAHLPSVFSGAGLVSVFAGIVAARMLYGLIGPVPAFAGLVATSGAAILLGWLHGPLLAAIGLLGAAAAPFLTGGDSSDVTWLYGYYALVGVTGLMVDTLRRWAWVSVLALVLAFAGGLLIAAGGGGAGGFAALAGVLALAAIAVPVRSLAPDHPAPTVIEAVLARGKAGWPAFPVRLAAGAMLAAAILTAWVPAETAAGSLAAFAALAALVVGVALWAGRAPGIADLAALPAMAFLGRLVLEATDGGPLWSEFAARAIHLRPPETAAPVTASLLVGLATLGSLAAARRSLAGRDHPAVWSAGAALFAPLSVLALEVLWQPALVVGAYPWALHSIALAAVMTALAAAFARADGGAGRRTAHATLAALALIAFALFAVLTKGALTLALAVLILGAAALGRRFRLPEMGWFMQAGIAVIGWRLIVDPGVAWAVESAGLWEVWAAYGGAAVAAGAALVLWPGASRATRAALESGAAAWAALLANVLLTRWLIVDGAEDRLFTHWGLTLNALPWLITLLVQLYRMPAGMRWLRGIIATVAGLIALAGLALAVGPGSPAAPWSASDNWVRGPLILDTLALAYLVPGLMLLVALPRLAHLRSWLRGLLGIAGAMLAGLYATLEIRRFWRGDDLSVPGVTQPELYTYTVALLVVGAALLWQAIAKRSRGLRRIAMAVIALAIAKVFLIDASGLSGLTRVFSFLALGLSLAALAWLNRWAAGRQGDDAEAA